MINVNKDNWALDFMIRNPSIIWSFEEGFQSVSFRLRDNKWHKFVLLNNPTFGPYSFAHEIPTEGKGSIPKMSLHHPESFNEMVECIKAEVLKVFKEA